MPLSTAALDHVAVAVEDMAAAYDHWESLGAVPVSGGANPLFATEQLRFANMAKVELIAPAHGNDPSFIDAYLARFGSGRIHHVTLKVPAPLEASLDALRADGLDVVDHNQSVPFWHEAFLRPSQVGGLVVQVAWAAFNDRDYARHVGRPDPATPPEDAPTLEALRLGHPDLEAAAKVWGILGGTLAWSSQQDTFTVTWPDSPIAVEVVTADTAGPIGLRGQRLGPSPAGRFAPDLLGI